MAGASNLIIPPDGDLSVQMLTRLLGTNWWNFTSGGSGSEVTTVLGSMFNTVDIALLAFISAMLVWQVSMGAMQTAHEGVTLGKRYHSIWTPVRAPMAFALLTPIPVLKGFSMLQAVLLVFTYWGIGMADTVWDSFTGYMADHGGTVYISNNAALAARSTAGNVLEDAVVWQYMAKEQRVQIKPMWVWQGTKQYGKWVYGQSTDGQNINPNYGTVSIACGSQPKSLWHWSSPVTSIGNVLSSMFSQHYVTPADTVAASTTPICNRSVNAANALISSDMSIAGDIIQQGTSQGTPPKLDPALLNTVSATYIKMTEYNISQITSDSNSKLGRDLKAFTQQAQNLGWASSAFYWWTISNVNDQANSMLLSMVAAVQGADLNGVFTQSTTDELSNYLKVARALIGQSSQELYKQTQQSATAGQKDTSQGIIARTINGFFAGKLYELPNLMMQGNLMANMQSFGHDMITVGAWMYGGGTMGAVGGFLIGAIGGASVGPEGAVAGSAVGAIFGKLLSGAAGLLITVGTLLMIEGAVLAYVLPMIPTSIMIIAVVGFLSLVIEMMVAAPLWAAAFGFADGDGLTPQEARQGFGLVGGIIMRPVLLVFGFVFAYLLMSIGGWFMGIALGISIYGMSGNNIGVVEFLALLGVIATMATTMVYFIMKLVTHLAQHVPVWIGGNLSNDLGVENTAASSIQSGESKGRMAAGAAVGYATRSVTGGIADIQKKIQERSAQQNAPDGNPEKKAGEDPDQSPGGPDGGGPSGSDGGGSSGGGNGGGGSSGGSSGSHGSSGAGSSGGDTTAATGGSTAQSGGTAAGGGKPASGGPSGRGFGKSSMPTDDRAKTMQSGDTQAYSGNLEKKEGED